MLYPAICINLIGYLILSFGCVIVYILQLL